MIKKIFPFLLLAAQSLTAQNFSIRTLASLNKQKEDINPIKTGNGFLDIVSSAKSRLGYTVTLNNIKMNSKLLLFDENMNLAKENELGEGKQVFGPFEPLLKRIGGLPFLIYYDYDNDNKEVDVLIAPVDTIHLTVPAGKKVLAIGQKNSYLFGAAEVFTHQKLYVETSPDQSKFLFFWYAGVKNFFGWAVTDKEMNVLKSDNTSVEDANDILFNNIMLDNDGNFFIGCTYKRKSDYYSGIFSGGKNIHSGYTEITLPDMTPNYVYALKGKTESQVRLVGLYSDDRYYLLGTFTLDMDKKSFKTSNPVLKPFANELISMFHDDEYAKEKKKKYGLYPELQLKLVTLPDGTVIGAGDARRYQTIGAGMSMTQEPVVGTTLVLVIKNDDIVAIRLPKKEKMGLTNGSDFYIHKFMDKAILFYHDIPSNLEKSLEAGKSTSFSDRRSNVAVAAIIEKDGHIERHVLNPETNGKYYFDPNSFREIDQHTLLFSLQQDKIGLTAIKTNFQFYLLEISE
jgi:hypothetical protein